MRRMAWLIFATAIFASAPLSLSSPPSWSSWLPSVTTDKAEAALVMRHGWRGYGVYRGTWGMHRRQVRRVVRRAWRWGGASYYAHPDGYGGYPYTSSYYAYRHVYAPPVFGWGWHRPHWGPVRGWHWWR
jgi:hypothetical protein